MNRGIYTVFADQPYLSAGSRVVSSVLAAQQASGHRSLLPSLLGASSAFVSFSAVRSAPRPPPRPPPPPPPRIPPPRPPRPPPKPGPPLRPPDVSPSRERFTFGGAVSSPTQIVFPAADSIACGAATENASGTFSSTSLPGVTVSWKWGAAVYTSFDGSMVNLGVKPTDNVWPLPA